MRLHLLLLCALLTPCLARAQSTAADTARAELQLADRFLDDAARQTRGLEIADRWVVSISLGALSVLGSAALFSGDDDRTTMRVGGSLSSLAMLGMVVPTVLARPPRRRQIGATGYALGAIGWGSTLLLASRSPRPCEDDGCISARSERLFGASLVTLGAAMLSVWLLPTPPTLEELQRAQALPEAERAQATARLLARMDRAQRATSLAMLFSYLASGAVLALGAATSQPGEDRALLTGFSGVLFGQGLLTALVGLRPPRLERFVMGLAPRTHGW